MSIAEEASLKYEGWDWSEKLKYHYPIATQSEDEA
jgi:hypothetical protein